MFGSRRPGDRHAAEELVELLVVADREDEVARRHALLVVAARVAGELEDLGRHVLEDGRPVHPGRPRRSAGEAHRASTLATRDTGSVRPALDDLLDDFFLEPPRPAFIVLVLFSAGRREG